VAGQNRHVEANLPTGTVTFLFTDIEGSTRLLQELGDGYAEVLAEHHRGLREVWRRYEGVEVDTTGDAFFVAFGRATDAVAAAAEAQRVLADGPVRVRMGLHTGEPLLTHEGYVGLDVHRAARIAAAGHDGQVLLSQTTTTAAFGGSRWPPSPIPPLSRRPQPRRSGRRTGSRRPSAISVCCSCSTTSSICSRRPPGLQRRSDPVLT
jgi:class 3 adenylate cyclase